MKKSRAILIALIIFICICCISATAATEDTEKSISTTDEANEISLEESEQQALDATESQTTAKSKPKSFTELNNKINGNGDMDIYLDCDYKYTNADSPFKRGINIDRRIYIHGNGHTIDGSHTARIFNVTAENVDISNINFINGNINTTNGVVAEGGAIAWFGAYGQLHDCTFINCTSQCEGGALFYYAATDEVIYNCRFINNYARSQGGGIKLIFGEGHIILNCTFIGNTAGEGGGGLNLVADRTFVGNCTFRDNLAGDYSGGLQFHGDEGAIVNSTFINNRADEFAGGLCINQGNHTILSKCILINNTCPKKGAAITIHEYYRDDEINVTECYIINNHGKNIIHINTNEPIEVNINNNIILKDNKQQAIFYIEDGDGEINANNNWFGNTAIDYKNKPITDKRITCDNWLFLKASASKTTIQALNTVTVTLTLCSYDGKKISSYNKAKLLPVKLTGTAEKGKLNKINIPITGKIKYTAVSGGTGIVKLDGIKIISFKIKKINPKLTAKAKTFYAGVKTKKYTATLKNSKKTPIKNSKISLKIYGKTFTAKTNKKGIATFKITNLYKKKNYIAVISYKGSSTYNKATKKVIIRCV